MKGEGRKVKGQKQRLTNENLLLLFTIHLFL